MPENVVVATASVGISADVTALEKALAGVPDMVAGVQSKVAEAASGMSATVASAFESWGPKLVQAGALMTAGITVPIVAATTALTTMGMGFEAEMTRVQVLSEASAEQLRAMTDQAIELGIKTPFSVEQAAQAMSKFSEQGFKANETMAAMPGVLALASAAQVETGKSAQATADILHGFKLQAEDAAHVADVLAKASVDSGTGVAEMANSFRYVGPLAAQLEVSIEEVAAMFEVLGDAGVRNAKAGTAIREMMMDLINPSKGAAEAMEAYGIVVKDATGNMLPLTAILEQFKGVQDNATNSTELASLAYSIWLSRSVDILPLIWQGKEALDKKVVSLKDATGAAEAMAAAMQQNVKGSLDQFTSSVDSAGKILFLAFSPYIKDAIDWARKLADEMVLLAKAFLDAPTWFKDTTVAILALAAAIGPVTALVGGLMTAWGTITTLSSAVTATFAAIAGAIGVTNPVMAAITVVVIALGVATYELWQNWDKYGKLIIALWTDITAIGKKEWTEFRENTKAELEFLNTIFGSFKDEAVSTWKQMVEDTQKEWKILSAVAIAVLSPLKEYFKSEWREMVENTASEWEWLKGKIAAVGEKLAETFPGTAKAIRSLGEESVFACPRIEQLGQKTTEGSTAATEYAARAKAAEEELRKKKEAAEAAAKGVHTHRESVEVASSQAKVFNVDLAEMSAYLERAKMRAEDAKLEVAFVKLNAELAKLPPNLDNVPPLLEEISQNMEEMALASGAASMSLDEQFEALNEEIANLPPNLDGIPDLLVQIQTAAQNAMRETGESMRRAGEQADALAKIWDEFEKGVKRVWENVKQGIGEIVAGGILELITGKQREELEKQRADLEKSMAEKTAAWEKYQVDAAEKLENLRTAAAEKLAAQVADLEDKLAEKEDAYDVYRTNTLAKIEEIKAKHEANLASQVASLQAALAEKELAYSRYRDDVLGKIEDIQAKDVSYYNEQLAALERANADKLRSYEEYAAGVARTMENLRAELADKIADETVRTQRAIADKQLAYDRYAQDIQAKIDAELAKGSAANLAQVADWRLSLARRGEDLGIFIARANQDLANFTADAKRQEEQKERDLQASLAAREAAMRAAIDENKRKFEEATAKHKAEADKQIADLQEALARRTADLEKNRQETEAKIESVTAKNKAELDKEVAALQASITAKGVELEKYRIEVEGKISALEAAHKKSMAQQEADFAAALVEQKTKFEAFKLEYETKLAEIDSKHKGVWGAFGQLALQAFGDVISLGVKALVDALWEMIKEGGVITAVKGAFTALANGISGVFKNLFDGIGDGINAATSSISGGVSGAGGAASGAGGGAASAAGGGLSGAISMISGAVTAVASVIQAFQLHGIGMDTGRIEEQTRKTANELANLRADEWTREEHWYVRTGEMWQATKDVRDAIGVLNTTAAEGLGNIFNRLGEMWNAVLAMVPGGAVSSGDGLIPPTTEGGAPSASAQAVLERLTSISETLQFAREFQLSHLESIAQALGGKNVDIPAGEVPLDADGNPIIPTIGIDPGSMESLLNMIQASNEHLSAISMSTLRAADALSAGTPGAGGSGATQIGDVLVGGGGIGTLNVTVNAETTSSADEIAGMVLEQILVYVPTGGA